MKKVIDRDPESQALIDLFAKRLDATMKEKDINAADLARMSGVSKGMISMYLRGLHEPGQSNTYRMARALRVSPAWLMALNGDSAAEIVKSNLTEIVLDRLNDAGKQRVMEFAADLSTTEKYKKGLKEDRNLA